MQIIASIKDNKFLPHPHKKVYRYGEDGSKQHNDTKGIWNFIDPDTYELLVKNLKEKPENWSYRNKSITYTLNSDGYRCQEFNTIDWKNSIVMFGCSHVFGAGNDDKETIPSFLESNFNLPVINMGINGSSIMTSLHNSLILSKKYGSPKLIIYMWTSLIRNSIYGHDFMDTLTFGYPQGKDYEGTIQNPSEKLYNTFVGSSINSEQILTNTLTTNFLYVNIIRNLWANKCPIYECSLFKNTAKSLQCNYYLGYNNDYARDDIHYGFLSNKKIATDIYKDIKKRGLIYVEKN